MKRTRIDRTLDGHSTIASIIASIIARVCFMTVRARRLAVDVARGVR